MKNIFYLVFVCTLLATSACTNLEETLREDLPQGTTPDPLALLQGSYDAMRLPYQDQSRFWAAQQHTSDETIGPTRGGDWDDNGIWRSLHDHSWNADHAFLTSTFSELLQIVFSTSNLLEFSPDVQTAAEARFLRAFVMNSVLDGWGQVPFRRDPTDLLNDAEVLGPEETVNFILSELDEITGALGNGAVNRANADAARVLRMKTLLNRGMFLNREAPTFDAADMNEVIAIADQIINSGRYSLAANVFDNFAPNNDQISTENIFTAENLGGSTSGNVRSRWFCTLHYNQNPSGWNGFTTLGDFYNSFEEGDMRIGVDYPGVTEVAGINVGFLVGPQFDQDGIQILDRFGEPLAYTPDVAISETGSNLEQTGVRVIKYPIDYNNGDNADNDYVYYRLADVMLMQAEAFMRTGSNGQALDIVNEIRSARGASTLTSINEEIMLEERGRELYWEGHRRNDQLRFGRFLDAWEEKPASGIERLLFPIPAASLAGNPNLVQNPGY